MLHTSPLNAVRKITLKYASGSIQSEVSTLANQAVWSKYLSAYNYGKFTPGIYRCNAVDMCEAKYVNHYGYLKSKEPSGSIPQIILEGDIGIYGSIGDVSLPYHPVIPSTSLGQLSLTKAYAKVNSPNCLDAGVFLGELAETIRMLRSPMNGIVRLLQNRRYRSPSKLIAAGSDAWMEFRYGIRPFISDIAGVIKLYDERESVWSGLSTQRDSERETKRSTYTTSILYGLTRVAVEWREYSEASISYISGVTYRRKHNVPYRLYYLGLTMESLPSLLWELTPLSFVADWFYNTGDWLRAIQPNPTVTLLGGYTSIKVDQRVRRSVVRFTHSSGASGTGGASADLSLQRLTRSCTTSLPALPVRRQSLLSLAQTVDSTILALQRVPKAWKRAIMR